MRWFVEVVSLELRRIVSSRVEFWVRIVLQVATQAVIAYFLWSEVMAASGRDTIGGYTLYGLVTYYIIAALIFNFINPDFDLIAREIYDGGLTRFIVYPVSLFTFKFASVVARSILCSLQVACVWLLIRSFFPGAMTGQLPLSTLGLGLLASTQAAVGFFIIICTIELGAFWVESVWNARLMVQFSLNLLGGFMIPISAFPDQLRNILEYTPFPWLISLPIRTLLGQANALEVARGGVTLAIWSLLFITLSRLLWKRGRMLYSGVGL